MSQGKETTAKQRSDVLGPVKAVTAQAGRKRLLRSEIVLGFALVLPTVVWVLAIIVYPVLYNIALSLGVESLDALGSGTLDQYRTVLGGPEVWEQLARTAAWTGGSLLAVVPTGLGIALLLNQNVAGIKHLRTWILLPWMFPVIVVVLMWRWLLEGNAGVVNYVLQGSGVTNGSVNFLGTDLAMFTVILSNAWRWTPFFAVVMLAALQNVPRELHEAAATDGANALKRFRYVTLPHLMPALGINTFLLTMWLFNMFPPIWLMTRGGPSEVTTTLPIALYHVAFERFEVERGAVLAEILFVFVALFSIAYWVAMRRRLSRG